MRDRTVLHVEDNEFNRRLVRDLLSRTSYRLIEATDGESGLATARQENPDVILVDIQLPKMSGLELTRALRSDPKAAHVPIIVITSFALSDDAQRAREAGASHYLSKPYSPRELLETIRRFAPPG